MYDFYVKQSGIDASRIHYYKSKQPMAREVQRILGAMKEHVFGQETASVGQATNIVKDGFTERDHTPEIRDTWMANSGYTETDFRKLVLDFGIPLEMPMVVIWSRHSGALGGLHPEHDTSYTGIAQMMERFADAGYALLIAGDDPTGKFGGREGAARFSKTVRLGQLWEKRGLWKKSRSAQFAFFEYLRRAVPTLTHVGMRSGNLEAYAYMGHRVIYLEEKGRSDSLRMDKISTDPAIKLNYRTVKLDTLPTITGQLMPQARRLAKLITEKIVPNLSKHYGVLLKSLDLGILNDALAKELESGKPPSRKAPYQIEMHLSRLIKTWVAGIAARKLDVAAALRDAGVNDKNPAVANLQAVLDAVSSLTKGFTSADLDNIFDAVVDFSSRIAEKPEADPDEMDFGDYADDEFSHDPQTMFWRELDRRIQRAGADTAALANILLLLNPGQRRRLRDNYQQDLDLMLGYSGRVTPKIQRLVVRIIDMIATHPGGILGTSVMKRDFPEDGPGGGAGSFEQIPRWGEVF